MCISVCVKGVLTLWICALAAAVMVMVIVCVLVVCDGEIQAGLRRRKKHTHVQDGPNPLQAERERKGKASSGGGDAEKDGLATSGRVPRSMVIRRGRHTAHLKDLQADLRRMMAPHTATKLKESKTNTLRDFVDVAGTLGVTHFLVLTSPRPRAADTSRRHRHYLKVCAVPRGPTLSFIIDSFSLASDVRARQGRPRDTTGATKLPPLVVLSGFSGGGGSSTAPKSHLKLASTVLQNLFPTINVNGLKLGTCRRVVLFVREDNPEGDGDRVLMRHYEVTLRPTDVHRGFRALTDMSSSVPDLSKYTDLSDWVTGGDVGYASDSDVEGETRVEVADGAKGRGGPATCKVRLHEIGPRLNLRMQKIEDGLCAGEVLFHSEVAKSAEEVEETRRRVGDRERLRTQRRQEQEANVRRKQKLRDEKEEAEKQKKMAKASSRRLRSNELLKETKAGSKSSAMRDDNSRDNDDDVDDDAEYFRREVGEDPDEEFVDAIKSRAAASAAGKKKKEKRRPDWITEARERQRRRKSGGTGNGAGGGIAFARREYNSDSD